MDTPSQELLQKLAVERAKVMERLQQIDDEAAELIAEVEIDLQDQEATVVRRRQRHEETWGHLLPPPVKYSI